MGQQTNVASLKEVKAAQAFLKAIGANAQNTDLLYAVIAWMRVESGGKGSTIGNNPFGLRKPDRDKIVIRNGKKYVKRVQGALRTFDSLTEGLIAMAKYLKDERTGWNGYGLILSAFRNENAGYQTLAAIALSAWDGAHYGYDLNNPDITATSLYKMYISFTGLDMPGVRVTPERTVTVKLPKGAPRDLPPPPPPYPYIDPGEAGRFYMERHKGSPFLD